jgi:hypothetical protein
VEKRGKQMRGIYGLSDFGIAHGILQEAIKLGEHMAQSSLASKKREIRGSEYSYPPLTFVPQRPETGNEFSQSNIRNLDVLTTHHKPNA